MMENSLRATHALQSHAGKQQRQQQQQQESYVLVVPEDEFRSSFGNSSSGSLYQDNNDCSNENHHFLGCDLLRNMYKESRAHAAASGVTINAKMPDIAKLYYAVCSPEALTTITMRSSHIGHYHHHF